MFGLGVMEMVLLLLVVGALIAFGAVVAVVLFFVLRKKPQALEGTAALPGPQLQAPFGAPAGPVQRPKKDPNHARTLAAADYTFDKIQRSLQQVGFSLQGSPGPEAAPGEPGSATFASGGITATYGYDPSCQLRMIDLSGTNARNALNDLLNIAYMPTLEGYKVSGLLESSNPAELYLGIRAAEFIGIGTDVRFYIEPVGKLASHPDPKVAAEARRVHAILSSR